MSGETTDPNMGAETKEYLENVLADMGDLNARHGAKSKRLGWWARMSGPIISVCGLIAGSGGVASLMDAFVVDEDGDGEYHFELGWQQVIPLAQAIVIAAQAVVIGQRWEIRSSNHNDTAGDARELMNKIEAAMADAKNMDDHDWTKFTTDVKNERTIIETGAPHL